MALMNKNPYMSSFGVIRNISTRSAKMAISVDMHQQYADLIGLPHQMVIQILQLFYGTRSGFICLISNNESVVKMVC